MKNIFVIVFCTIMAISCSKSDFQKTSDSIKSADSLIKQANEGIKTLDFISKIVNDSAKFRKIVVPEIEKHTKEAEKIIKENNINLDSLNKEIKKATDKIGKSTDILKSVDSVGKVLNETKNPIEKITTVTDAINKVVKNNSTIKKNDAKKENTSEHQNSATNSESVSSQKPLNPIGKILKIELSVDNADDSRNQLSRLVKNYGGEITNESFGAEEGVIKQLINAKIPYQYFEDVSQGLSQNVGIVLNKNIDSYGTDYDPNQKCDIIVTLKEKNQSIINSATDYEENKQDTQFAEKSSNAFMKGFHVLRDAFLFLLPFWPIFLLLIMIYFIYRRNKKKRLENEHYSTKNNNHLNP